MIDENLWKFCQILKLAGNWKLNKILPKTLFLSTLGFDWKWLVKLINRRHLCRSTSKNFFGLSKTFSYLSTVFARKLRFSRLTSFGWSISRLRFLTRNSRCFLFLLLRPRHVFIFDNPCVEIVNRIRFKKIYSISILFVVCPYVIVGDRLSFRTVNSVE